MGTIKRLVRKFIPAPVISAYHFLLAYAGALAYGFPSRNLLVIAVTGTKGKSSVTEMLNAIFEGANRKTALLNSIRIKIGGNSEKNLMRMSMPGRFFIQRFLSRAAKEQCDVVILEMTSEGSRQHRHRGIALDCLVFTNLAPEHIESHGTYENYADAKFQLGRALARSPKRPRIVVANSDDVQSSRYLALRVEKRLPFSLADARPYEATSRGGFFTFKGTRIPVHLPGEFSLKNALAAATAADAIGIPADVIDRALDTLTRIPGRAEEIDAGQDFSLIVDYAHTPDSLQALYDAYRGSRRICILGSTGGGRDTWKRPVMGSIADKECDIVILTNEDPYDEDPRAIVEQIANGMKRTPTIIMNRREAIAHAISCAKTGDAILISGKGTDPTIAGPNGTKIPWSDAQVAYEEVKKRLGTAV